MALAALPYLNTLHNLFVYDDTTQVVNNPYLQNFHHLKEIFTTPVWSFLGGDYPHNYYRPLMSFGYLLCYQFLGPIPLAFHLVNLVLNLLVVLLLFFVTWRMFNDRLLAFVAAGLFAVHPIHSESVAWIAAITDLELALFYLLTFWFFLGLSKWRGRRLILGQLSMAVSFALALLAKEPAVTLVVLATLYEHFCREDRKETSVANQAFTLRPALAPGACIPDFPNPLRGRVGRQIPVPQYGAGRGNLLRPRAGRPIRLEAVLACYTLRFLCLPHEHESFRPAGNRGCCGVDGVGISYCLLLESRAFGLLRAALLLPQPGPRLERALDGRQCIHGALPVFAFGGILLGSGLGGDEPCGEQRQDAAPSGARSWSFPQLAIAALCTLRIIRRNRDWHDDETFYKATLALQPDAYIMHLNLAALYLDRDDFKNAEQELREAEKVAPDYPLILDNFGLLNLKLKRYDEALGYLIRSILKNPKEPQPHLYLAQVYDQTGQTDYAEKEYLAAINLSPLSHARPCRAGRVLLRPWETPGGREAIPRIPPGGQDAAWLLGAGVGVLA